MPALDLAAFAVVFVAVAYLAVSFGELRRPAARRRWPRRRWPPPRWPRRAHAPAGPRPLRPAARPDAADQLRAVMRARFETRRLLSPGERRVFLQTEAALRARRLSWRVMAQVSLGEILASPDPDAYAAVNSKRADLLLVTRAGEPIAVIEYQGEGHYQEAAAARDAVKKEALRRAGVDYIEVTPRHTPDDLARAIGRLAEARLTGGVPRPHRSAAGA
jgi:hypothetical protein